jgi:type IV fimbrial biogenesis protein FimU
MDFGSRVRQSKAHRGLHSPCLSQGSRGFTLIELIIVVVIVGIFAALAAPSFTSLIHKNNVTTTANEFYDLLQYSRGEAASRGTSITMSAPGSSNSAWNGDIKVILTNQGTVLREIGTGGLQTGVAITTAIGSIVFSSTGSASPATCFTFTYTGDTSIQTQYVGVLGSGRISVPSTTLPTTGECN